MSPREETPVVVNYPNSSNAVYLPPSAALKATSPPLAAVTEHAVGCC